MTSTRKQAEELLGASLPPSASNIHFYRYQPSPQLTFFEAYIRFDGSEAALFQLQQTLGLSPYGSGGEASAHLPGAWRLPPGVSVPFWDASPETPAASAAKTLGPSGWIIAKYERGHVYVIVTNTE